MSKEIRREILLHGLRWANNILVEILSNHAIAISEKGKDKLKEAVLLLERASSDFSE